MTTLLKVGQYVDWSILEEDNLETIQTQPLEFDWATMTVIVGIHIAFIVCCILGWYGWIPNFLSVPNILTFFGLYMLTGWFGITAFYHRYLSHRSYVPTKPLMYFLGICGTLAFQGSWVKWTKEHIWHHLKSDTFEDVHDSGKGFLWSHILWMFYIRHPSENEEKIKNTLPKDAFLTFLGFQWVHITLQILLAFLLYFIGGWGMVAWGIFGRIIFVWHATWLVNSATHKWGYRTFETNDHSQNLWWVALPTFGEGWHNNHHRYPDSAQTGMEWWEVDLTYKLIQFFHLIGMVKSYRTILKS